MWPVVDVVAALGTFVGLTVLFVRRRDPVPAGLTIPRSWRVTGWFVWGVFFLGRAGAPKGFDIVPVSLPTWLATMLGLVLLSGLAALGACLIWVATGAAYFGDPRALRWALVVFGLEGLLLVFDVVSWVVTGTVESPGGVVVTAALAVGGLIAARTARRTPVRYAAPATPDDVSEPSA